MPNRDEENYEEVEAEHCPYCYTRGLDRKATRSTHCGGDWEDYDEDEEDESVRFAVVYSMIVVP